MGQIWPAPIDAQLSTRLDRLKRPSSRKLSLLCCACCRRVWDQIGPAGRRAVESSERYADRPWSLTARHLLATIPAVFAEGTLADEAASWTARGPNPLAGALTWRDIAWLVAEKISAAVALSASPRGRAAVESAVAAEQAGQCELFADLFEEPASVRLYPDWLAWGDGIVPRLAAGIYEENAFARMPILGDALEDAGCDDEALLAHCRRPGAHARGCWVVDRILGKG